MKKIFKKGDTLHLKYMEQDNDNTISSVGIVYSVSETEVTLAHNFSGLIPIDTTKIPLNRIIESRKIIPNEIKSLNELNLKNKKL